MTDQSIPFQCPLQEHTHPHTHLQSTLPYKLSQVGRGLPLETCVRLPMCLRTLYFANTLRQGFDPQLRTSAHEVAESAKMVSPKL